MVSESVRLSGYSEPHQGNTSVCFLLLLEVLIYFGFCFADIYLLTEAAPNAREGVGNCREFSPTCFSSSSRFLRSSDLFLPPVWKTSNMYPRSHKWNMTCETLSRNLFISLPIKSMNVQTVAWKRFYIQSFAFLMFQIN